ncbi:MAG: ribosome small subunit-dependent GTPase [Gammaproteobacteria bacterium]|nr:ribosome small subunit-dependent GTPase [Gammaproteobacteria bacterium]
MTRRSPLKPRSVSSAQADGRVIRHHGRNALVETASGERLECTARKRVHDLACGDRVEWSPAGENQGVIERVLPRASVLTRPDHRGRPRALAANVDQLLIVIAPEPEPTAALIDRYLIAAELMPARPVLVLNKTDRLTADTRTHIDALLAEFAALGMPVVRVNTREPGALQPLIELLATHTSILVGQSGVGKSSLVNALLPEHDIRVGELSEASGQGRHTTSDTTLYHLPGGGELIDSPGVRDFHLWHIDKAELAQGFCEFRDYAGRCRFHNCRHLNEPGCAVQAAVDAGEISARRLESYRKLYAQLEAAEERLGEY